MATTYVAYLLRSPTDTVEPNQRIEWLKALLSLDIDLILCVDSFFMPLIPSPFGARLRILLVELSKFEIYQQIRAEPNLRLPPYRNTSKDTEDYMIIQNLKPELLQKALQLGIRTPYVAYIDAGIVKIFKDPKTIRKLETIRFRDIPFLLIPGCHPMPSEPTPIASLEKHIHWTFCGGFFVMPTQHCHTLFQLHKTALKAFLERGTITWEVNVWASYLPNHPTTWFAADHNDTMVSAIPDTYLASR